MVSPVSHPMGNGQNENPPMTLSIEVSSQGILGGITSDYHMQPHKNNYFPASKQTWPETGNLKITGRSGFSGFTPSQPEPSTTLP